jgi:hypothetical protein
MIAPAEVICVERCSTPGVNRLCRSEPAQSENQALLPGAPRETDTDLNESLAASRKSHFTVIRPAASSKGSAAANDVPARDSALSKTNSKSTNWLQTCDLPVMVMGIMSERSADDGKNEFSATLRSAANHHQTKFKLAAKGSVDKKHYLGV